MIDQSRSSGTESGLDNAEQRAAVRERYSAIAGDEERNLNDYVVSATNEAEKRLL